MLEANPGLLTNKPKKKEIEKSKIKTRSYPQLGKLYSTDMKHAKSKI